LHPAKKTLIRGACLIDFSQQKKIVEEQRGELWTDIEFIEFWLIFQRHTTAVVVVMPSFHTAKVEKIIKHSAFVP